MKERPILFSSNMVSAILAGTKSQTRRVVKEELRYVDGKLSWWPNGFTGWVPIWANEPVSLDLKSPFGEAGDKLWVRETWRTAERDVDAVDGIEFRADAAFVAIQNTRTAADLWIRAHDNGRHNIKWRPSIFMPRWASRITLDVTDVRYQQLQEISEEDAIAEGVIGPREVTMHERIGRDRFQVLWDQINGKKYPWESNPWIRAISFKRTP